MNKLGPILEQQLSIVPFDRRSSDVIAAAFRGNDASHAPFMMFDALVDENDEISFLQVLLGGSPFCTRMEKRQVFGRPNFPKRIDSTLRLLP